MQIIRCRCLLLIPLLLSTLVEARGSRRVELPTEETRPDLSPVHLNPESVKDFVTTRSDSILFGLNSLHQSKLNYSLARAELFPSLNIGGVVGALSNPSFLIPGVDVLLPFLIPSNWFKAASAKRQWQSDQIAFRSLRKDVLASSLSLYRSILRDQDLHHVLSRDLEDLRLLEEAVRNRHHFGLATDQDLKAAETQRILAELRTLETRQFLRTQFLELKKSLALDPRREIILEDFNMDAPLSENDTYENLVNKAWEKSGSRKQLEFLRRAATNNRWSSVFAFFGGTSLSSNTLGSDKYPRFGAESLYTGGHFNLSYAQIPAVRLANTQLEHIDLMIDELHEELSTTVAKFVQNLEDIKTRRNLSRRAETLVKENFEILLQRYRLGIGTSFQDVLNARLGMQQATVKRLESERELDLARISLSRMLSEGFFESLREDFESQ